MPTYSVIHCETKEQAETVLKSLDERMKECKLQLHPEKTRIVYCKDSNRTKDYPTISFDFLGYTFRARKSKNERTGELFTAFTPAVSKSAVKRFHDRIRKAQLTSMTYLELDTVAMVLNPIVRGWMNYYGAYCPSEMRKALRFLNRAIGNWARHKYKGINSFMKIDKWLGGVIRRQPKLFYHWTQGFIY